MKWQFLVLIVLGTAQMAGDLFHLPSLKAIAAATCASPAPKVFSSVRGLETYSTAFFLAWTEEGQLDPWHGQLQRQSVQITPELYSRLRGPYNRRNVYGAVVSFGPVLSIDPRTKPMFDAVARYSLCGDAPLLRELGLDEGHGGRKFDIQLRLVPIPNSVPRDLPLSFSPTCN